MMGIPHPRIHLKVFLFSLIFTIVTLIIVKLSKDPRTASGWPKQTARINRTFNLTVISPLPSKEELRKIWIQKKIDRLSSKVNGDLNLLEKPKYKPMKKPNDRVHIFYYAWYRSVEMDEVARHWNDEVSSNEDFGLSKTDSLTGVRISFYPQEGFYSSRNQTIIDSHMQQLKASGIGVAVVYWRPPGFEDSPDEVLIPLLDSAAKSGIQISIHINPYYNWSIENLLAHIKKILTDYGSHNAFYTIRKKNRELPVFYVYDPFDLGSAAWASLLAPDGSRSIRNTKYDGIFIGLLADLSHRMEIKKSHFDGFYTYFAGNGYTYGSSWKNWQSLAKFARDNQLLFVPCVAPGYAEPGGGSVNRPRHKGNYFEVGMRAAVDADPDIVGVTSFNAWEEGSQIEAAVPKRAGTYVYLDYGPYQPDYYLELTGWWVKWWTEKTNTSSAN